MSAYQKLQRSNGPNMKQGFGGQKVKLHTLNCLTFPYLFQQENVMQASFQRSILLPVSRRWGKTSFSLGGYCSAVMQFVYVRFTWSSCRLCRLQTKHLPRDEVLDQQPMLGFATNQACSNLRSATRSNFFATFAYVI